MARNERLRRQRILRNWRQQDVADELGTALITIQRWERGIQHPSAYYRIKLCELFGLSTQDLGLIEEEVSASEPESAKTTPAEVEPVQKLALWTVPFARNPHFTGRDDLLNQLAQQLSPREAGQPVYLHKVALTQAQAIKGLGDADGGRICVPCPRTGTLHPYTLVGLLRSSKPPLTPLPSARCSNSCWHFPW